MSEKMTPARANEIMDQGFHCSQVVLIHAAERMGLDKDMMVKLGSGLGAGCNHGDTCGAISGAIIALGLVYGFSQPNSGEQDAIVKEKVRALQARFVARYGSTLCRHLLGGWDVSIPAHCEVMATREGVYDNCGDYCTLACDFLDEMLAEAGK